MSDKLNGLFCHFGYNGHGWPGPTREERRSMTLLLYLAEIATLCDVAGLPLTHPLRGIWIAAASGGFS